MRAIAVIAIMLANVQADPLKDLNLEKPNLFRLFVEYERYRNGLELYAKQQGFLKPYENLATVMHEIIHIASASHQGYYIDGVYFEPYASAENWPSLKNRDIAPLMRPDERGLIHAKYMRATPENGLGNILDEVNAYTHVMEFVCQHEPASANKQIVNLVGHLHVIEAYLRVTRTAKPLEYARLSGNRLSAGAIKTITSRAWAALQGCGLPVAQVPRAEAEYLSQLRK